MASGETSMPSALSGQVYMKTILCENTNIVLQLLGPFIWNWKKYYSKPNQFVLRIHSVSFSHGIHVNEKNGTLRLRFSVIWKQNLKMANSATIAVLVLVLSTATLVLYQLANAMMHRHRAYLHHRRLRTSLLLASPLRIRSRRQ